MSQTDQNPWMSPNGTGMNVAPSDKQAPAENEVILTPVTVVNNSQLVEVNPVLLVRKEATPSGKERHSF